MRPSTNPASNHPTSWDTDVENIKPEIKGRSGNSIMAYSSARKTQTSELFVRTRAEFENRLKNSPRDPLAAHVWYVRTLKDEVFVAGHSAIQEALKVCMDQLAREPQYRADERLLSIAIEYAACQADPREVFAYLRDHRVCTSLPRYHLAVAAISEQREDYQAADMAFREAITCAKRRVKERVEGDASAKDALEKELETATKHLRHFQRRMAKKLINSSSQTTRALHGPNATSPVMNALRRTDPVATATLARSPQFRAAVAGASVVRAGGSGIMGSTSLLVNNTTTTNNNKKPAPSFSIFADASAAPVVNAPAAAAALPRTHLPGENQGPVQSWGGNPLPGNVSVPSTNKKPVAPCSSTTTTTTATKAPFTVWTEDTDVKSNKQQPLVPARTPAPPPATTSSSHRPSPKSGLREAVNLFQNLSLADQLPSSFTTAKKKPALAAVIQPPPLQPQLHADDMTVNTRGAMSDLFDVFASPSMQRHLSANAAVSVARPPPSTQLATTARPARTTTVPPVQEENEQHHHDHRGDESGILGRGGESFFAPTRLTFATPFPAAASQTNALSTRPLRIRTSIDLDGENNTSENVSPNVILMPLAAHDGDVTNNNNAPDREPLNASRSTSSSSSARRALLTIEQGPSSTLLFSRMTPTAHTPEPFRVFVDEDVSQPPATANPPPQANINDFTLNLGEEELEDEAAVTGATRSSFFFHPLTTGGEEDLTGVTNNQHNNNTATITAFNLLNATSITTSNLFDDSLVSTGNDVTARSLANASASVAGGARAKAAFRVFQDFS